MYTTVVSVILDRRFTRLVFEVTPYQPQTLNQPYPQCACMTRFGGGLRNPKPETLNPRSRCLNHPCPPKHQAPAHLRRARGGVNLGTSGFRVCLGFRVRV